MVRHAAMLRNIFVVGDDGETAWQRARGAPCIWKLVHVGKVARCKCRSTEGGIGESGAKWSFGLCLGVEPRTGQHILFDPEQWGSAKLER